MKTGTILMTERPVCPRCGQKQGYGAGKPPQLPPDTPMPSLSDGRIRECEKRRGKLFGHQEVIIVRRITVNLDPVSYRGLIRTMQAYNMTRQEAARRLILGTVPKFVGQCSKSDDDW